jgi:four helix bundle protein
MYGEVQAAESRNDFIHKMRMLLKELRETRISLRIINEKPIIKHEKPETVLKECNEHIGIFTASIGTANKNKVR